MKPTKAGILIACLSSEEAAEFVSSSLASKKPVFPILLSNLQNGLPDKEQLFESVYDKKYDAAEDARLRNDLRRLAHYLEQFIREKIIQSEEVIEWLNFLQDREANALFEKEIKTQLKDPLDGLSDPYLELVKLNFRYRLKTSDRKEKVLLNLQDEIIQMATSCMSTQPFYAAQFLLFNSITERIMLQYFKTPIKKDDKSFDRLRLLADPTIDYLLMKASSFSLSGEAQIDKLLSCVAKINEVDNAKLNRERERAYLQTQLGLSYFLLPEYQKASNYFSQAYLQIDLLNKSQKIQLIYNYLNCLLASEGYSAATSLIAAHGHLFYNTAFQANMELSGFMALLLSGQTQSLREALLEQGPDISKDVQLYSRIQECIVFYYEDDFELCSSRLENIYNTGRYNEQLDKAFVAFSKLFQKLALVRLEVNKDATHRKLMQLNQDIDQFINAYELGFGSNMLLSKWLSREIAGLLAIATN